MSSFNKHARFACCFSASLDGGMFSVALPDSEKSCFLAADDTWLVLSCKSTTKCSSTSIVSEEILLGPELS